MAPCPCQPFLSLPKWIQSPDYFANTTAKVTTDSYWGQIGLLRDWQILTMLTMLVIWTITKKRQWPGDMRASIKSIVHLQQSETVDFEAENQAMVIKSGSIQINSWTDFARCSNLMIIAVLE